MPSGFEKVQSYYVILWNFKATVKKNTKGNFLFFLFFFAFFFAQKKNTSCCFFVDVRMSLDVKFQYLRVCVEPWSLCPLFYFIFFFIILTLSNLDGCSTHARCLFFLYVYIDRNRIFGDFILYEEKITVEKRNK